MTSWSNEHNFVTFKFPLVLGVSDYHEFSHLARLLGFLAKAKVSFLEVASGQGQYPEKHMPYTAVFYVNYTQEVADVVLEMKKQAKEVG